MSIGLANSAARHRAVRRTLEVVPEVAKKVMITCLAIINIHLEKHQAPASVTQLQVSIYHCAYSPRRPFDPHVGLLHVVVRCCSLTKPYT